MKRLLTILSLLVLALVIAHAATARWAGIEAERQIRAMLEQIDRETVLQVRDLEYDRGWWSSRLRYTLEARHDGGIPALDVNDHIRHGPLISGNGLRPGLGALDTRARVSGSDRDAFAASGLVALDGRIASNYRLHELTLPYVNAEEGSLRITLGDGEGTLVFDPADNRIVHQGRLSHLLVEERDGDGRIQLDGIRLDQNTAEEAPGLWAGALGVNIDRLRLWEADGDTMELAGIRLEADVTPEGETFDGTLSLAAERVSSGALLLGPGRVSLSLERIGIDAWSRTTQLMEEIRVAGDDETVTATLLLHGPELLRQFLGHGPRIRLGEASLEVPDEGRLDASARINYPPDTELNMFNPLAAVNALEAELEFRVPVHLVRYWRRQRIRAELDSEQAQRDSPLAPEAYNAELEARLDEAMHELAGPWFVRTADGEIRSHIRLENGVVSANGNHIGSLVALLLP